MPAITGFTGLHNSGKTTVARRVIEKLRSMGYRIAVLKSTSHEGIEKEMDKPGSDTALYRDDGIEAVGIIDSRSLVLFQDHNMMPVTELAQRLFHDFDLVVLEGFKQVAGVPRIEVVGKSSPEGPLYRKNKGIEAVVSDEKITDLLPGQVWFQTGQTNDIALFIEKTYIEPSIHSDLRLYVNGKPVDATRFVTSALTGTITGFLTSLRGTEGAEQVDISFRLSRPDNREKRQ
jgi:molybdopterin-guanine dinucleotide biosynthesis protein B